MLTVTCYPECDASTGGGVLDIFDFLCFQNAFVAGCPQGTGRYRVTGRLDDGR